MKQTLVGFAFLISIIACGCARLKPIEVIQNGLIDDFKYVVISPTNTTNSSSSFLISGQYILTSESVNPADVIAGRFTKAGFVRIPTIDEKLLDQTLIVNYGESGRRKTGLGGYTVEVMIQLVSAASKTPVCSCTAEGQGETEADDIRIALRRCLSAILGPKK